MVISKEDLKILEGVPAGDWHTIIGFAQYLSEEHRKKIDAGKKRERPRLWGTLEGKVWMSDDFNDPLDFVSEDEMQVLEAMRASNRAAVNREAKLQEAAV